MNKKLSALLFSVVFTLGVLGVAFISALFAKLGLAITALAM